MRTNRSVSASLSSPTETHIKYRPDIDGLRAIAVLLVVAFHAYPNVVHGGFIGVDIFFVISGFLISTIIYSNLENNTFSFTDFYARRIKRIFPALIVVLFSTFALGWFLLLADEYKQLGKHIAAGAAFVSNFLLINEVSYFDNAAETKPLLHLWSLGIEEQFYIFWPLLLWLWCYTRSSLIWPTIFLAIISFLFNLYKIRTDAIANFYLPQSRFWELLCGAILAWYLLNKNKIRLLDLVSHKNLISFLGLILLMIATLSITSKSKFPGWVAVIPVMGAVLIILAGPTAWINRVILSNRLLVWVGLISFPLYLWHWPLLTLARIVYSDAPSTLVRSIIVLISFFLAWFTYQFIEKPIRFSSHKKSHVTIAIILMIVIGYIGFNSYQREGLRFREVDRINSLKDSGSDGGLNGIPVSECSLTDAKNENLKARCVIDNRDTPKFAVIGDSKALAIHEGLMRTSQADGRWLFIGSGKEGVFVPVIADSSPDSRVYLPYTQAAINFLKSKDIKKVAVVTSARMLFAYDNDKSLKDFPKNKNYSWAYQGLLNTLNELLKFSEQVILVIDNPTLFDPKDCLNRQSSVPSLNKILPKQNPEGCKISVSKHLEYSEQYRRLLNNLESQFQGRVKIFDTTHYMCDIQKDICQPSKDGRLMYSYSDHISDYAAGIIGTHLNNFMRAK